MSFGISRKLFTWTCRTATRSSFGVSTIGPRLGLVHELHSSTTTTRLYPPANIALSNFQIQPRRKYADEVDHEVGATHSTSNFDKRILVWTKYYSSVDEVPNSVSHSKMKRAKDIFRIRCNIWMAVWTVVGCVIMIVWGRRSAKQGDSLHKQNLEWHEELKNQK